MFSVLGIRVLGYWVSGSWHWYLVVGIGFFGMYILSNTFRRTAALGGNANLMSMERVQ